MGISAHRIAVIGFGQWGPNHARNFQNLEHSQLRLICDRSDARRDLAQKAFRDVACVADPSEVFNSKDVDAVVIATPVHTHEALVTAALKAGKDVLCEKPLAASPAVARKLANLAEKTGRILMVGHVFLYNPGVTHLKQDLSQATLGRIYYMDAVRTNLGPVRSDVGAIHDLASHDVSIFNHLLGAQPEFVSATGGSFLRSGIEDIGFLTLTYPNDVVCHVHTSWLNPRKVRQLTIVGDRKMAVWDDMNNLEPIRYYDKGVTADHYASFGEFQMILRDGAITIPKIKLYEPLLKQDEAFIECLSTRRPPAANALFATQVVNVLDAARRSLANGGRRTRVKQT